MLMKSLFDKAAEYGSKAKNLAGGYLQGEKGKRSPEAEEIEKVYSEKFTGLKKEIETFQFESIKNYEDKINHLNELINKLNKENELANAENKKLDEDNKNMKISLSKLEIEKNSSIKDLEDKLKLLEEKYLHSEKLKNELSAEIAKIKQTQIKENFVENFNEMKNKIEEDSKLLYDENKIEKFLIINEEELQKLKEKLNEYLETEKEEKEEFSTFKNDLITKYIEKYEQLTQENFTSVSNTLKELKNTVESNINMMNEKLTEYSHNSDIIHSENLSLKEEISRVREESFSKTRRIEEIEARLKIMSKESEKIQNELNCRIDNLDKKNITEKKEKENFANALKETQDFIKELEKTIEVKKAEIQTVLKEKEEQLTMTRKLETEIKEKSELFLKNQQTFKQFFLLLLEEDVFIDIIEKVFKNTVSDTFFEEIYKLSKLIKPKMTHRVYNKLVSNEDMIKKLSKFNLEVDLDEMVEKYQKPLSLDFLNDLAKQNEEDEEEDFISDIILELCGYIDNLNNTIIKQGKNINELSNQLKSVKETLEESKKNDGEKYDLLNKHIFKLQQDCREYQKTEKLMKENEERLENLLRDSKVENEKFTNKIKSLNTINDECTKEKNALNDKINNITQQCDLFKVENLELIEQNQKNLSDNQLLRQRNELLLKEKEDLSSKVAEIEKLKNSLREKNEIIKSKEQEIIKLNDSHADLEEFIENLKSEKEHNSEIFKKQMVEMAMEIETLKETNRLHEDRLQNEPIINKNIEDLEKTITNLELENKHLKDQKDKIKKYSEEILLKVKNDLKDTEFLVDKRMISNILIKYFDSHTNEKLKYALLDTLANFMAFSNEERRQIGLNINNNQVRSTTNASHDKLKDLSDELYNFILNS